MSSFSDEVLGHYRRDGYIVLKQLVPTSLVRDLRRQADLAKQIIHGSESDGQKQRLQPVTKHADRLDMQTFRDFCDLPPLRDAISAILSAEHRLTGVGEQGMLGLLMEPVNRPYCTDWHRDITLESSRLPSGEFGDLIEDFNQINCPLYDDSCTWYVPGSHLRLANLPGETTAAARKWHDAVADATEQEQLCRDYTANMPGAVQLHLSAGDLALYNPFGWHTGNYLPYRKRATLHDVLMTPALAVWWHKWIRGEPASYQRDSDPA